MEKMEVNVVVVWNVPVWNVESVPFLKIPFAFIFLCP